MSDSPVAISASPAHSAPAISGAGAFWVQQLVRLSQAWPGAARAMAPLAVRAAWAASPALRDGTMANAARILGTGSSVRQRRRLARGVVRSFYLFICEMGEGGRGRSAQRALAVHEVRGREHFDSAMAMGRGVIIVTAHLGSFESGIASLRGLAKRVHVVFKRDEIPGFERLRSAQRERLGVIEAPVDEGWPMWLRLRDALAEGDVVLMQGDRVMPGQSGVRAPMLGSDVMLPLGPLKLAMATGAPILPVFSVRRRGGEGILQVIGEPIVVQAGTLPRDGGVHPAMLRLAGVIERQVRDYPEQWLMLHRVWCDDWMSEQGATVKTT